MKVWIRDSAAGGGAVSDFGDVAEVEVGGYDSGGYKEIKGESWV